MIIEVKLTDDILIAGNIGHLNEFSQNITKRYRVRKVIINKTVNFNRCTIKPDENGHIKMHMTEFSLEDYPERVGEEQNERKRKHSI